MQFVCYNISMIKWKWNDADAYQKVIGYRGTKGDCVTRAIAIATGKPYKEVYEEIKIIAAKERRGKRKKSTSHPMYGVHKPTIRKYLESLGWKWTPTMHVGSGCTVHLRADELPKGTIIVSVSRHLTCVIDGIINDLYDCSRKGTRCVYGYWTK